MDKTLAFSTLQVPDNYQINVRIRYQSINNNGNSSGYNGSTRAGVSDGDAKVAVKKMSKEVMLSSLGLICLFM